MSVAHCTQMEGADNAGEIWGQIHKHYPKIYRKTCPKIFL